MHSVIIIIGNVWGTVVRRHSEVSMCTHTQKKQGINPSYQIRNEVRLTVMTHKNVCVVHFPSPLPSTWEPPQSLLTTNGVSCSSGRTWTTGLQNPTPKADAVRIWRSRKPKWRLWTEKADINQAEFMDAARRKHARLYSDELLASKRQPWASSGFWAEGAQRCVSLVVTQLREGGEKES